MKKPPLYGLMAEFTDPQSLLDAAHKTYKEGYRKVDAFSPFPIEGLSEAIGFHHTKLPVLVLIGGICGCAGGFGLDLPSPETRTDSDGLAKYTGEMRLVAHLAVEGNL